MKKQKNIVNRDNIKEKNYLEILEKETHHSHPIIKDEDGVLRWLVDENVRYFIDERISLNDLLPMFHYMGYDKNSEVYRKLYRDIGYSLSGYWEIFYWEVNNPNAAKYVPNKKV